MAQGLRAAGTPFTLESWTAGPLSDSKKSEIRAGTAAEEAEAPPRPAPEPQEEAEALGVGWAGELAATVQS